MATTERPKSHTLEFLPDEPPDLVCLDSMVKILPKNCTTKGNRAFMDEEDMDTEEGFNNFLRWETPGSSMSSRAESKQPSGATTEHHSSHALEFQPDEPPHLVCLDSMDGNYATVLLLRGRNILDRAENHPFRLMMLKETSLEDLNVFAVCGTILSLFNTEKPPELPKNFFIFMFHIGNINVIHYSPGVETNYSMPIIKKGRTKCSPFFDSVQGIQNQLYEPIPLRNKAYVNRKLLFREMAVKQKAVEDFLRIYVPLNVWFTKNMVDLEQNTILYLLYMVENALIGNREQTVNILYKTTHTRIKLFKNVNFCGKFSLQHPIVFPVRNTPHPIRCLFANPVIQLNEVARVPVNFQTHIPTDTNTYSQNLLVKSVCKIFVKGNFRGTGFVLFDNFIFTNRHLFDVIDIQTLQLDKDVVVLFEECVPCTNYNSFLCKKLFLCPQDELDYAVLELQPGGQKAPGLLQKFGPVPLNGKPCIIGYPAGELKVDHGNIIEKERREQAVNDHLQLHKDRNIRNIIDSIQRQGIQDIMTGGKQADKVVTYSTSTMSHGSSGSPVFDANGRVFGLHTGGFWYDHENSRKIVMAYSYPLLDIFKDFVRKLKESGNYNLLKRIEEEAQENKYLERILYAVLADDPGEPMEID